MRPYSYHTQHLLLSFSSLSFLLANTHISLENLERENNKFAETLAAIPLFRRTKVLHALIGKKMVSIALGAVVPYPGKATRISHKGQRGTKLAAIPVSGHTKVLHTLIGMVSAAPAVLCYIHVRWFEFPARDKEALNWQPHLCLDTWKCFTHWQEWVALLLWWCCALLGLGWGDVNFPQGTKKYETGSHATVIIHSFYI